MFKFKHSFYGALAAAALISLSSTCAADSLLPEEIVPDGNGNYSDELGNTYVKQGDGTFKGTQGTIIDLGNGIYDSPRGKIYSDGAGGLTTHDGYHYIPDGNGGYMLDE